jgi:hypothetical protein
MSIASLLLFVCGDACGESSRSREVHRLGASYFLYAVKRILNIVEAERYIDQELVSFCV